MYIGNRLYPYPVLREGTDDYASGKFTASIQASRSLSGEVVELDISYQLDNEVLSNMLKNSQATVVCHIECSQTAYRELRPLRQETDSIIIQGRDIAGKVELCVFILAAIDLPQYANTFNDDYGGQSFSIEAGSPLAIGLQLAIFVEKQLSDIEKVQSIIKIKKDPMPEDIMKVDLEDNLIIVFLPEKQFFLYESLTENPNASRTLHSLVIIPVLVHTISLLKVEPSEYHERLWYRAIDKAIKREYQFDIESEDFKRKPALEMAQAIIGRPLDLAFQFIAHGFLGENDSDED